MVTRLVTKMTWVLYDEIGLHSVENKGQHSKLSSQHKWEGLCDKLKRKKKSPQLASHSFCISTPTMTLETPVFMIHNFCYPDETLCGSIKQPKVDVELEVSTIVGRVP